MVPIEVRVHLRPFPVNFPIPMDHLEGRVVLHGCCGGAPAAWGLPLLPLDVLRPRRAAGPSDWLPQSAALLSFGFC